MMTLRSRLPKKLKKAPLIEALWQVRFKSNEPLVPEILTGLVYSNFKAELNKPTEKLPLSNLPIELIAQQPNLQYLPSTRLHGVSYGIGIGPRVLSLSAKRPYDSWGTFSDKIYELAKVVDTAGVVSEIENFSIKYVNCLTAPIPISIDSLAVSLNLAGRALKGEAALIRTEITELSHKHAVQIGLPGQVQIKDTGEQMSGIVVDVETFGDGSAQSGKIEKLLLDRMLPVRNANKTLFFSLLAEKTLEQLEPVYDSAS